MASQAYGHQSPRHLGADQGSFFPGGQCMPSSGAPVQFDTGILQQAYAPQTAYDSAMAPQTVYDNGMVHDYMVPGSSASCRAQTMHGAYDPHSQRVQSTADL